MNKPVNNEGFVFTRENYIILFIGIGLMILGFLLMIGGGSDDPNHFSEALFSVRRLTVAPIMVLAGFGVVLFAIIKKPRKKVQ